MPIDGVWPLSGIVEPALAAELNDRIAKLGKEAVNVKFVSSVPTVSTIREGEIVVYDDDAGTVRLYLRTAKGNLVTVEKDHGSLSGLGDDDHSQYHNDARAVTWHDADDHSNLTVVSAVKDTDGTTSFTATEVIILSVAKTITSGKTVSLIASGTVGTYSGGGTSAIRMRLKHGSTVVHIFLMHTHFVGQYLSWALNAIVTGLSGSVTFTVTAYAESQDGGTQTMGSNLQVLEF